MSRMNPDTRSISISVEWVENGETRSKEVIKSF